MTDTIKSPLATYRNDKPYPFCPGCGHRSILDQLNTALVALRLDPKNLVLVTDIGCCGLSDQFFSTNAFHGLHGRSITYATGIKLARPELKVIVIMGDGGTGIGGAHLLNAARRNIGVTVLVCNNLNFGMTGGQHSTTTPNGAITSTSPKGNLERPLDICATVAANGAGYVWRGTCFDDSLSDRIVDAVRADCFALLDIWELCTAYFVQANHWSKKSLRSTMTLLGMRDGVLHRAKHPEYSSAYRESSKSLVGQPPCAPRPIRPHFRSRLSRPFRLVVAGSAGGKVRSTARLIGEAALLSGLWAAQRDDYPITVKAGHSVAELVLSPGTIEYTGITCPDAMILLSGEGVSTVNGLLTRMRPTGRVYVVPEFACVKTAATITVIDPSRSRHRVGPECVALYVVTRALIELGIISVGALKAAVTRRPSRHSDGDLAIIEAAVG